MDTNQVTIEMSVDVKHVMKKYMRSEGVRSLLGLVRECSEEDAVPAGTPDSTPEGTQCYLAAALLVDLIDDLANV